jgi:hypothetical protein
MQFVIARNALQKELAFVQGIVERKNTIPVLANILKRARIRFVSVARIWTSPFDAMRTLRRFPPRVLSVFRRASFSTLLVCCRMRR